VTTSAEDEAPVLGARRAGLDARPGIARKRPLRQRLRLPLMLLGPIVVLAAAGYWYLTTGRYVSTDDAYVQAARVSISTDVSGRVAEIDIRDNEQVKAGQVLFSLDQRPFIIAVEEAKAQLAAVRLQIEAMKATYQQKLAEGGQPRPRSAMSSASSNGKSNCSPRAPPPSSNSTAPAKLFRPTARSLRPSKKMLPTPWPALVEIPICRSTSTRWSSTRRQHSTAPS